MRGVKGGGTVNTSAPSATVVVKGLSQKTTEEDLYQILAEWGPLRHVRVIKERNSGISRGFAFIDFPSVEAACAMMDRIGDDGLVVDGRKLFFEYSSKPTGGAGGSFGLEKSSQHRNITVPSDWMCTICGCVNFARRTSCFQCNEPRTDDAPPADMALSNPSSSGKKGFEAGPTHVLVVRGLDENADEEMLRYEFSKHAPIKDLRLVRDKFTHVSRGFAFVHFHSVEDATKALDATNGTALEKNGQILRVAYAKSILGPGSSGSSHMMLLDGHLRNITQMTNNLSVGRSKLVGRFQLRRMILLHNLLLCGMKHLVITMMLLLASILMEIQWGLVHI
uniref:RNA-binding protein n=1 Tax=Salix viminalis TaxID=40686 RepID=A0A6N2LEC1_SALVM